MLDKFPLVWYNIVTVKERSWQENERGNHFGCGCWRQCPQREDSCAEINLHKDSDNSLANMPIDIRHLKCYNIIKGVENMTNYDLEITYDYVFEEREVPDSS